MNRTELASIRHRLENLIALAGLLERVERSPERIGAEQYQQLVARIKHALGKELPAEALQAVLAAHPATAVVYENLHYHQAGLSRSSLERSVASEMLTSQLLD